MKGKTMGLLIITFLIASLFIAEMVFSRPWEEWAGLSRLLGLGVVGRGASCERLLGAAFLLSRGAWTPNFSKA